MRTIQQLFAIIIFGLLVINSTMAAQTTNYILQVNYNHSDIDAGKKAYIHITTGCDYSYRKIIITSGSSGTANFKVEFCNSATAKQTINVFIQTDTPMYGHGIANFVFDPTQMTLSNTSSSGCMDEDANGNCKLTTFTGQKELPDHDGTAGGFVLMIPIWANTYT